MAAFSTASPPRRSAARLRQTELGRVNEEGVHRTVATLGHLRVTGIRDFVDASRAVHDPRALRPEKHQRPCHHLRQLGPRDANDLSRGARRVGQRAQQIERRPDAHLTPDRPRMPHGRMEGGREEEGDVCLSQRLLNDRRRRRHVDAKLLENIRAAAAARHRIDCRASRLSRRTPPPRQPPPTTH